MRTLTMTINASTSCARNLTMDNMSMARNHSAVQFIPVQIRFYYNNIDRKN